MATREQIQLGIRGAGSAAEAMARINETIAQLGIPIPMGATDVDRTAAVRHFLTFLPQNETGWSPTWAAAAAQPPAGGGGAPPAPPAVSPFAPSYYIDGAHFGLPGTTVVAEQIGNTPKYNIMHQGFLVGDWDRSQPGITGIQSFRGPAPQQQPQLPPPANPYQPPATPSAPHGKPWYKKSWRDKSGGGGATH